MKTVGKTLTISWEVHDSWTELLAGTRYLLDLIREKDLTKIPRITLVRLTLVTAYQMTEIMFFRQLRQKVESKNSSLTRALEYDLREKISFEKARRKWPEVIMGITLPLGEEPLQSMEKLGQLRNSAIHYTATSPSKDIGECALFTAIEASKTIYNFFNGECWNESEYSKFAERYKSRSSSFIASSL